MAWRYGNRHSGRGEKGTKGWEPTYTTKTEKKIQHCFFYVESSKHASDNEITAEFVINHIKKTFDRGNDISEALRTLSKVDPDIWKPSLKVSTDTDNEIKQRENEQYEMEYETEIYEALERKRQYTENMYKAFDLLWERCTKAMQDKILGRTDYQSKIYNNPIALLRAIKEHSLQKTCSH